MSRGSNVLAFRIRTHFISKGHIIHTIIESSMSSLLFLTRPTLRYGPIFKSSDLTDRTFIHYRNWKTKKIYKKSPLPHLRHNSFQPMAYFWVQLLAVVSYLFLSVLYICAISGTKGSSGFGSVNNEQIDNNTYHPNATNILNQLAGIYINKHIN